MTQNQTYNLLATVSHMDHILNDAGFNCRLGHGLVTKDAQNHHHLLMVQKSHAL